MTLDNVEFTDAEPGAPGFVEYETHDGKIVRVALDDEAALVEMTKQLEQLAPQDPAVPLLQDAASRIDTMTKALSANDRTIRSLRRDVRRGEERSASVPILKAKAERADSELAIARREIAELRSEVSALRAAKARLREALNRTKDGR